MSGKTYSYRGRQASAYADWRYRSGHRKSSKATTDGSYLPVLLCLLILLIICQSVRGGNVSGAGNDDYSPPEPGTYRLPIIKAAADGDVLDSRGRSGRLRELTRGRVTDLSFIY